MQLHNRTLKASSLIRPPLQHDAKGIMLLLKEAHFESAYAHLGFSDQKVLEKTKSAIQGERGQYLLIAEKNGDIVAIMHAYIGLYLTSDEDVIVSIQNFYLRQDMRKTLAGGKIAMGLMHAIMRDGRAVGAKIVSLNITSGIEMSRTHKMAKRMNMRLIGANFTGVLA